MEYRACYGFIIVLSLFNPCQAQIGKDVKSDVKLANVKPVTIKQEVIPISIAIPSCPYGEPLIYRKCDFDHPCPCGYECNRFTGRCCPSDPDDICNDGELRKGKCGPKDYPCPCGQQCRNHPAKGYVVCCPNDDCPERECKYGYPLENRMCGYGKLISCPTGYECNNHRCCPIKQMPGMCEIGEPVAGNCDKCPAWYKCYAKNTWCCATEKCKIGQPLPGVICGGRSRARCPTNYACIYSSGSSAGYCCRSLIRVLKDSETKYVESSEEAQIFRLKAELTKEG